MTCILFCVFTCTFLFPNSSSIRGQRLLYFKVSTSQATKTPAQTQASCQCLCSHWATEPWEVFWTELPLNSIKTCRVSNLQIKHQSCSLWTSVCWCFWEGDCSQNSFLPFCWASWNIRTRTVLLRPHFPLPTTGLSPSHTCVPRSRLTWRLRAGFSSLWRPYIACISGMCIHKPSILLKHHSQCMLLWTELCNDCWENTWKLPIHRWK